MELYKVILLYFALTLVLFLVANLFKNKKRTVFISAALTLLIVITVLFAVGVINSLSWLVVNFVCSAFYIMCAEDLRIKAKSQDVPVPEIVAEEEVASEENEEVDAKDVDSDNDASEDVVSEEIAGEDAGDEIVAGEDVVSEDVVSEDIASEEIANEDIDGEDVDDEGFVYEVEEDVQEGVSITGKLDTPLAKIMFAKAIEKGFMTESGRHYQWNEKESKALLAYMCGRIYCGDMPEHHDDYDIWKIGRVKSFPDTALNELFQEKELARSRSTRINHTTPYNSTVIDEMIDQCQMELTSMTSHTA